jgi:hypothetical protein
MFDQLSDFQKNVIYASIILFIAFLVIACIALYYINKNKKKGPFPDKTQLCPDYWEDRSTDADGSKCLNVKNLGKSRNRTMDFTKSIWKGDQGICNKSEWAKTSGLSWDGVTNNIRVPCKNSTGLVERDYLIVKNTNYAKQFDIGSGSAPSTGSATTATQTSSGTSVDSLIDCQNLCDSTAGCNGFSYNENEGKCYLKSIIKGTEIPSYDPNGSIFVTQSGYKSYKDAENICTSEKDKGKCSVLKNNKCKAMLKDDGNVIIYDIANKPVWASNTYNKGNGPYSMKMQDDGNLVVYDVNNEEIWSSGTTDKGDGPYRAELDESCTMTVYDSKNKNLWFGNEGNSVKQEANSCSSSINYGLCLKQLSSSTSKLIMQDDGNLCVYDNGNKLIWQSGSNGKGTPPYRLMMQTDGNLVIYDSQNKPTWATGTNGMGKPPYKLKMRKDMSLEIMSSSGLIWTNKYRKLDNTDYGGQFDINSVGGSLLACQNTCNETDGCNAFFYQDSTKQCWLKNVKVGTEVPNYNKTGSIYVNGDGFKSYKEGFTSSMTPETNEDEKKGEGDNGSSEADTREGFKTWRDIQYYKIEKTDYTGQFDIRNAAGTVEQCKELCTTTDGCNAFAFKDNHCWLKDVRRGSEYPRFRKDVDTYVRGNGVGYKSYKDAVPKFNIIQNTDYGGQGDIKSMQGSVDDCKFECDSTPGCNSFFYADAPKTCWLKGLNRNNNPNYHSGGSLYEVAGTGLLSYKDGTPTFQVTQNTATGLNDPGGGNTIYLDRHNVECGNSALKRFKLVNHGNQYRYDYSCSTPMIAGQNVTSNAVENVTYKNTPSNDQGGGYNIYLDRHHVDCGDNAYLSQFLLSHMGIPNRYQYNYKCNKTKKPLKCRVVNNTPTDNGLWNARDLDKQDITCNNDEVLNSFRLYRPYVTFYEHCDYQGRSWSLPEGTYDHNTMVNVHRIPNDTISSIRIPKGFVVAIFNHDIPGRNDWMDRNYGIPFIELRSDIRCLVDYGWNDVMSSFIIKREGPERVSYEYKCCKF